MKCSFSKLVLLVQCFTAFVSECKILNQESHYVMRYLNYAMHFFRNISYALFFLVYFMLQCHIVQVASNKAVTL